MKNLLLVIMLVMASMTPVLQAHTIGGAYASLVECEWGQWGNEYGHIGTYDVNGKRIQQFFGNNRCPY